MGSLDNNLSILKMDTFEYDSFLFHVGKAYYFF